MAVPLDLYNSVQGKYVSEVMICECFVVLRIVESRRDFFQ